MVCCAKLVKERYWSRANCWHVTSNLERRFELTVIVSGEAKHVKNTVCVVRITPTISFGC